MHWQTHLTPWKKSLSGKVTDHAQTTSIPFVDVINERKPFGRKLGAVLFRRIILGVVVEVARSGGFRFQVFWKLGHEVKP